MTAVLALPWATDVAFGGGKPARRGGERAAAVGAALAGASVSATDANGQAIAVSATTANNGTYTLDLPKDVTFPVVLWVRAQDQPLFGPSSDAPAGSTITAHVTPIAEAAS